MVRKCLTIQYFIFYGMVIFFTIQYFQRYCMVMAYHIPYAYNIVKNPLIRGRASSGWMMANEMTLPKFSISILLQIIPD